MFFLWSCWNETQINGKVVKPANLKLGLVKLRNIWHLNKVEPCEVQILWEVLLMFCITTCYTSAIQMVNGW